MYKSTSRSRGSRSPISKLEELIKIVRITIRVVPCRAKPTPCRAKPTPCRAVPCPLTFVPRVVSRVQFYRVVSCRVSIFRVLCRAPCPLLPCRVVLCFDFTVHVTCRVAFKRAVSVPFPCRPVPFDTPNVGGNGAQEDANGQRYELDDHFYGARS